MRPTLLSIGIFEFHAYAVAMALAFLVGVLLPIRENYRREKPYPATPIAGLWVFLGGMLGARIYWILQYDTWRHLHRALFVWQGGLVFYGGLIGGTLGCIAYLKYHKIPLLPAGDIALPYVPLAHAIGRIGCFLNGCCWGAPTGLPWGVSFPHSKYGVYADHLKENLVAKGAAVSLPVHPTQLYEAAGLLAAFVLLKFVYRRRVREGVLLPLYLLIYGFLRFTTETFRGDSARPLAGMTVSQVISLGMMAGAGILAALLWTLVWRHGPAADAERGSL